MRTLITGGSGLVGSALVQFLHSRGQDIRCLKRIRQQDKQQDKGRIWNTDNLIDSDDDPPFDTVIHLAGENVATGRWSNAKKERILKSRVDGTRELVDYLATLETRPSTLLCASAVGFYGNRDDEPLLESSGLGSGFLADVCKQWEAEANKAQQLGIRVVNLRFGMVLSPNGGALHKMLPPFRMGVGGPIGKGNQYMSWVTIRDIEEIVDFLIHTPSIKGPVNVVAPSAVTNREFTRILAESVSKPAVLPTPPFALRRDRKSVV